MKHNAYCMKKNLQRILLVSGIAIIGMYWFSSVSVFLLALLRRLPVESEAPTLFYGFSLVSIALLPFAIRALYRRYCALDPIPASSWPAATKPEPPSEDKDPKGWYSVIEDAGYGNEISYGEYVQEGSLDVVLSRHHKAFTVDSKDDAIEELLAQIEQALPNFTHSYKKASGSQYLPGERRDDVWYYKYKGEICGEAVDIETDFSHFVPDILNPIISRKLGLQLLFAFPGSDSYGFILVQDDKVEKVKSNPYYWDYPRLEYWYGYGKKAKS